MKFLRNFQGTDLNSIVIEQPINGPSIDFYLVFSDGLQTLSSSSSLIIKDTIPVYFISNDVKVNHGLLKSMAHQSGGEYFNLLKDSIINIIDKIGKRNFSFLRCHSDVDSQIFPSVPMTIKSNYFEVAGKIEGHCDVLHLTLDYGIPGNGSVTKQRVSVVMVDSESSSLLVARYWAQKQMFVTIVIFLVTKTTK